LKRIFVSELNKPHLSYYLGVYDPKVVIYGLIKDHVINELVNLLSHSSYPVDSIHVNKFKESIDFLLSGYLLDERPQKLDQFFVFVVNAEEQAVEQRHWVLLDVS